VLGEVLIIVILILANGLFAGAEIAVVSIRKTRLQYLVDDGSVRARDVMTLRKHPERFLATVQIGITVIGASAAAFGGSTVAADIVPFFARIAPLAPYAEEMAFALVIALVSYLSLVLGELVPKSLALRSSEAYALAAAKPLLWLSWFARPLVWLLTSSSNLVLRPFGDKTNFTEARLSVEELQQLVAEATKVGSVDRRAGQIAARALDFGELTAADLMVPRNRVIAVQQDASHDAVQELLGQHDHTRMPVFGSAIDDVVGYVTAKDVLAKLREGQKVVVRDILRPAHFVPQNMPATAVMRSLQEKRTHLAVVVDEHGGMAGVITLEDLVEELVGEIFSEHDKPLESANINKEADDRALVHGHTPIRELNRALGLDLPEDEQWTTVSGLCSALAGRIPERGSKLTAQDGTVLEIIEASPRAVRLVRVVRAHAPEAAQPSAPS
jgi:putative hemolysin